MKSYIRCNTSNAAIFCQEENLLLYSVMFPRIISFQQQIYTKHRKNRKSTKNFLGNCVNRSEVILFTFFSHSNGRALTEYGLQYIDIYISGSQSYFLICCLSICSFPWVICAFARQLCHARFVRLSVQPSRNNSSAQIQISLSVFSTESMHCTHSLGSQSSNPSGHEHKTQFG
jgi:hypothetical protein